MCVTLGNHAFDQKEALVFIERHDRLLRPLNYPRARPGKGAGMFKARNGADVLVINAMGRVFMTELDCPFRAVDARDHGLRAEEGADAILIDFHAEATSEKQAIGLFLDGRASCVVGTHTHAPTADERVLPAAPPSCRMSACAATTNRCSAWTRGAAQPLPDARSRAGASSRPWARRRCRAWRSRSTTTGLATAVCAVPPGPASRAGRTNVLVRPEEWLSDTTCAGVGV